MVLESDNTFLFRDAKLKSCALALFFLLIGARDFDSSSLVLLNTGFYSTAMLMLMLGPKDGWHGSAQKVQEVYICSFHPMQDTHESCEIRKFGFLT